MPQGATPVSLRMQALAAARFDDTSLRTSPSQFIFTKTYTVLPLLAHYCIFLVVFILQSPPWSFWRKGK